MRLGFIDIHHRDFFQRPSWSLGELEQQNPKTDFDFSKIVSQEHIDIHFRLTNTCGGDISNGESGDKKTGAVKLPRRLTFRKTFLLEIISKLA